MRAITATILLTVSAMTVANDNPGVTPQESGTFDLLREPSGVTSLDGNTLIVIEDEAHSALRRLEITPDNTHFKFKEFKQATGTGFIQRRLLGPLDDLEAIARLSDTRFFVIGSHENASRGKKPNREKLVLFTRKGDALVSASMRRDLFEHLVEQYPQLSDKLNRKKNRKRNTLNIEGLAFDRKRQELLIGLRSPTISNDAIIIRLLNATDYLEGEEPEFADALQLIDLDKGGIRALAYDDRSDNLLLISQRESGGNGRWSLWTLSSAGDKKPTLISTKKKHQFKDIEGLTPLAESIFFVRDAGDGKSKNDEFWFTVSRSQLGLDEQH